jgi:hypothetical protein
MAHDFFPLKVFHRAYLNKGHYTECEIWQVQSYDRKNIGLQEPMGFN